MLNLAGYIHSPDHSTKGTRSLFDELSVLVNTRFQVLFHSPSGVLFTFPSQYFFTIGHRVVFRLGGWSPHIPTGFHVSGGTLDTDGCSGFSCTGFLFLALLRCFSSGGSPHIPMYSVYDDKTFLLPDCSIRKSADQSLLTAPRSLSQLVTSFFGSRCQGIPLVLFVA